MYACNLVNWKINVTEWSRIFKQTSYLFQYMYIANEYLTLYKAIALIYNNFKTNIILYTQIITLQNIHLNNW